MKLLNILLFISFTLAFVKSQVLNSQYIYTFPDSFSFFMIDIKTGEALYNQSLPYGFEVVQVITNKDNNTLSLFGFYQDINASEYLIIDYNFVLNTFTNTVSSVVNDSCTCGKAIQNYVIYDNNFYIPVVDQINPSSNLIVVDYDFNSFTKNDITIIVPDYNSTLIPLSCYDNINNIMYILYYGEGLDNPQLYLSSTKLPVKNNVINNIDTIKLPINGNNSIPFNYMGGILFTTSNNGVSYLYYIQNYQKNVTIYQINQDNGSVHPVASFEISGYTSLYDSMFFTSNNKYLVLLDYGDASTISNVYYRFIDLSTFKLVYTFNSLNFYNNKLDDFDLVFYFNNNL